jgi:hypothetical protein
VRHRGDRRDEGHDSQDHAAKEHAPQQGPNPPDLACHNGAHARLIGLASPRLRLVSRFYTG